MVQCSPTAIGPPPPPTPTPPQKLAALPIHQHIIAHSTSLTPLSIFTMPHADATNFSSTLTRAQAYAQLLDSASALVTEQRNWVCNLSNTASLLWHMYHSLPGAGPSVNWAGFYVLDPLAPAEKPSLILGPFMGKVACQTIMFGRGVCGTVAASGETLVVKDVEEFPGHIACDGESRSEVVVPIVVDGKVRAIIDIDCTVVDGFGDEDKEGLEKLAKLLADSCDF